MGLNIGRTSKTAVLGSGTPKGFLRDLRVLRVCLIGFVSFVSTGPLSAQQPSNGRVPVLVELFTSEGCNSCPPADRILEMLSKEQPVDGVYIVALSEHVTYWDHQGWKDPFGAQRYTQRQNAYGSRFKLESVFTPQLIIDGATQFVGTDTAALKRALEDAAGTPKPRLTVEAALDAKGGLSGSVSGPGLEAGKAEGADLLWAVTEDDLVVEVKRGENANRTLRHSGVVRTLVTKKIEATGATPVSATIQLESEWKRENLRLVAFVQSAKTKRVLSVGWAKLAPLAGDKR